MESARDTMIQGSGEGFISGARRLAIRASGQVDNYRILDELGSGGMAVVYRAEDTRLHRQVALKILHDHIANRPENRERFEREARAVARLKHANIMSVYGFSTPTAPVGYIAAELIDGETLRQLVEGREFAFPEIGAMICLKLGEALEHAHESGIIHRDFKPENAMITSTGVPKLMDFGLARLLDHHTMTMTGAVLGSPAHMSPEAIEGKPVDRRVDIFAFGTVLFYAATGRLPFDGRNPAVILNAILVGRYPDPTMANPRVGARLAKIIEKCLETDPDDRYPSVSELNSALRGYLSGLGLDDVAGELRAYFSGRDEYEAAFKTQITERLAEQAETALSDNRMAAALALCDQILAIEDNHPSALKILGQANTKRKVRRSVLITLAAALLLFAGWSITAGLKSRPIQEPPAPFVAAGSGEVSDGSGEVSLPDEGSTEEAVMVGPTVEEIGAAFAAANDAGRASLAAAQGVLLAGEAGERAERVAFRYWQWAASRAALVRPTVNISAAVMRAAETEGSGESAAAEGSGEDAAEVPQVAEIVTVPVSLRIAPITASVRIDGIARGMGAVAGRGLRLAPGIHTIELNVPQLQDGRLVEQFAVTAEGRNDFAFRVPWPDAFIVVNSTEPGNVIVDGRPYPTGERIRVPIPVEGEGPERDVEIQFLPPSGAPTRGTVRVRTELTTPVAAPF